MTKEEHGRLKFMLGQAKQARNSLSRIAASLGSSQVVCKDPYFGVKDAGYFFGEAVAKADFAIDQFEMLLRRENEESRKSSEEA